MMKLLMVLVFMSQTMWASIEQLESLRMKYDKGSENIESAFKVGLANIKKAYHEKLIELEKGAVAKGDLSTVLKVKKELSRFTKNQDFKTSSKEPNILMSFNELLQQKQKVEELRSNRYQNLNDTYVKYLQALEIELTKQEQIKDALIVRREKLKYDKKSIIPDKQKNDYAKAADIPSATKNVAISSERKPREFIPGETEAHVEPKSTKRIGLSTEELSKRVWVRFSEKKPEDKRLFRVKAGQIQLFDDKSEAWRNLLALNYNAGLLKFKKLDFVWDVELNCFKGQRGDERYYLVQDKLYDKFKKEYLTDGLEKKGKRSNKLITKDEKKAKS